MEQLLVTRKEAARLLSSGDIKAITIGSRVYYSPEELRAFITKEGALC